MTELVKCISENADIDKITSLLGGLSKDTKVLVDLEDFPEKVEIPLLSYASSIGNADIVRKLYEHGLRDNKDFTAVRFVDGKDATDILQFLMINNANINYVNKDGHSPLSYAIRKRKDVSYIEQLLKRGADPNIPLISFTEGDKTHYRNPTQVGISRYHKAPEYYEQVLKLLLLFGSNPKLRNNMGKNSIEVARDFDNETLAHNLSKSIRRIVKNCSDDTIITYLLDMFKVSTTDDVEENKKKLCNCLGFLRRDTIKEYDVDGESSDEEKDKIYDKITDKVFSYDEDDEVQCFFREDIPSISITEINPLTSNKFPKHVLKTWYDDYEKSHDMNDIMENIKKELDSKKLQTEGDYLSEGDSDSDDELISDNSDEEVEVEEILESIDDNNDSEVDDEKPVENVMEEEVVEKSSDADDVVVKDEEEGSDADDVVVEDEEVVEKSGDLDELMESKPEVVEEKSDVVDEIEIEEPVKQDELISDNSDEDTEKPKEE